MTDRTPLVAAYIRLLSDFKSYPKPSNSQTLQLTSSMSGPVKPYLKDYAHWLDLTPDLQATAQSQLREPASQEACIAKADELLEQVAVAGISTESGWFSYSPKGYAVMYLRWAKWDVPKALKRIQNMDQWHHDALQGHDSLALRSSDVAGFFNTGLLRMLGRKSHVAGMLAVARPTNMRHAVADPNSLLRWNAWFLRRGLHDKYMQVHGWMVLETFAGFSFMEAVKFTTHQRPLIQMQMRYMNECAPFRVQAIVMTNQPTFFSWLYTFLSAFMSAKMKSRIRLLGKDYKKLHAEFAAADTVPHDFGGSNADNGEAYFAQLAAQEAAEEQEALAS